MSEVPAEDGGVLAVAASGDAVELDDKSVLFIREWGSKNKQTNKQTEKYLSAMFLTCVILRTQQTFLFFSFLLFRTHFDPVHHEFTRDDQSHLLGELGPRRARRVLLQGNEAEKRAEPGSWRRVLKL